MRAALSGGQPADTGELSARLMPLVRGDEYHRAVLPTALEIPTPGVRFSQDDLGHNEETPGETLVPRASPGLSGLREGLQLPVDLPDVTKLTVAESTTRPSTTRAGVES